MELENYKKMKQGDRVEYLLLKENLKRKNIGGFSIKLSLFLCLIFPIYNILFILFSLLLNNVSILIYFASISKIWIFGIVLAFVADLIISHLENKRDKKFDEDFFKGAMEKIKLARLRK